MHPWKHVLRVAIVGASVTILACQSPTAPVGWSDVLVASGVHGKIMHSYDLRTTWMTLVSPVTTHLNGVHSDGRRFAIVGNDGTLLVLSMTP